MTGRRITAPDPGAAGEGLVRALAEAVSYFCDHPVGGPVLADGECGRCYEEAEHLAPTVAGWIEGAVGEAVAEFAHWVATNRAYNGSPHDLGQSLYNECLNGVLPSWAESFIEERKRA